MSDCKTFTSQDLMKAMGLKVIEKENQTTIFDFI